MRKFRHYTFEAVMIAFGTSVFGLICYSLFTAFTYTFNI